MNCINEYNEEMILTYHDRNALKGFEKVKSTVFSKSFLCRFQV